MLALVVTLLELRAAECRVACGYLGYDSGRFNEEKAVCECVDEKPYEEITRRKRIQLPRRKEKRRQVESWPEAY